jgi:HK97 family phage portal protein
MAWFFKKKEERANLEEILITSGVLTSSVSKQQVLNIPAVTACVELISMTVASLPIKLYSETGESTTAEQEDPRIDLLNEDTQDLLNGFQAKKAMVEDYLLNGAGYMYMNRKGNNTKSLHYVENSYIGVNKNTDPIFKRAEIMVNGNPYRDWEFVKLLRKTKDGVTGTGIIKENNTMLSVAYNQMIYEEVLVKTGGNKKGFLRSQGRLSKEAMDELRASWKKLYGNNDENILVLNNGLEFTEASQTSVELQLNEHKRSNSDEICKMFLVPPSILTGEAGEEEYNNWIKTCILPILTAFESALNKDLLLPSEQNKRYFAFDTTELTKGSIEERFTAYQTAIASGFMQIDEVRYKENLPPLKLNWIKMGLQDVLYFPKTEEIYTPNTNKLAKMGENPTVDPNGGDNIELNKGLPDNSGPSEEYSAKSDNPSEGK